MDKLSFEQINKAKFRLYAGNPIVCRFGLSTIIADPSVLSPNQSHDGKWHMFCHTLFGVYHYTGGDGINFEREGKILNRAMRPNINFIDGKYYLYYERVQPLLKKALSLFGGKWFSEIYVVASDDLRTWSKPVRVVGKDREYHSDKRGSAISNPFLINIQGKYRLYYSAGQTYIEDCKFCEPTHISYAESEDLAGAFVSLENPIISPDKSNTYLNLCSGCIKIYELSDCYIGLQNGIYLGDDGKSHSAIMLLRSEDGKTFEFVKPLIEPKAIGDNLWMAQFVYACHLVCHDDKLWLYFNARDVSDPIKGRENIGVSIADISVR